jgi:hypothetical protein
MSPKCRTPNIQRRISNERVEVGIRKGPSQKEVKSVIKKTVRDYRTTLRKLA